MMLITKQPSIIRYTILCWFRKTMQVHHISDPIQYTYLWNVYTNVHMYESSLPYFVSFNPVVTPRCGTRLCYNGTCVGNTCVCFQGYQGPECFERACTFVKSSLILRVAYTCLSMQCCRYARVPEWRLLLRW